MSAHINMSEDDADRILDNLCERTGTTREFWMQLGDDFIEAQRMIREGDKEGLAALASRNVDQRAETAAKAAREGSQHG